MKQSKIFVLDKCEITVDKKIYSEHELDLHNKKVKKCYFVPRSPLNTITWLFTSCFNYGINAWKLYLTFSFIANKLNKRNKLYFFFFFFYYNTTSYLSVNSEIKYKQKMCFALFYL